MAPIHDQPLIGYLLQRLSLSKKLDQIIVATSDDQANDRLEHYVTSLGYPVFRGSESDVLDRYYQAACSFGASIVVRITGDCPLVDPGLVDLVLARLKESGADYVENAAIPTYPNGLETEAFTFETLVGAWRAAVSPYDREHVTPYIRNSGQFSLVNCPAEADFSQSRWTVDEPEDLPVVERVFGYFYPNIGFSWREVLTLEEQHPEWFSVNRHIPRNEGATMTIEEKRRRHRSRNNQP